MKKCSQSLYGDAQTPSDIQSKCSVETILSQVAVTVHFHPGEVGPYFDIKAGAFDIMSGLIHGIRKHQSSVCSGGDVA